MPAGAATPARFTPAALAFLAGLARHNDRDWFNARKPVFEAELRAPLLELIAQVNHGLARFAPDHVRDPAKIAMRIYRDTRFSKNKAPYKTNIGAWWARAGMEKTSGGGFYLGLDPAGLTLAAGVYMPDKDQTLAIRRMLAQRHADFRKLVAARPLRSAGLQLFDGLPLARAPKGFSPDDPAADLIRQRQWGVSTVLPAEAALAPALVKTVVASFRAAAPLVHLLNEPLGRASAKPMF